MPRRHLRSFSLLHRHPKPLVLSRYLDGELGIRDRRALEAHVDDCAACRGLLHSLQHTVRALGTIQDDPAPGVADSVIAALAAQSPPEVVAQRGSEVPALTVIHGAGQPASAPSTGSSRRVAAQAAIRYCLQRPRLRVTVPIALLAGVILTMVNMGGDLMTGQIDFGMCVSCSIDFLVPFLLLNAGLLTVARVAMEEL